jgi:uncharacterized protein with NAD-binding domain and iron-sulfur cluster
MKSGKLHVAVLGGGVAGLTCAHELVERGFHVTLYEQRSKNDLGGKARSYTAALIGADGKTLAKHGPAEHGFRFFPGFYRHIDETTKDIPISPELARKLPLPKDSKLSVLDCLVPISTEVLAASGKPIIELPASAPPKVKTLRSAFQLPQQLLGIGLTQDDLSAFSDKMWQIATSCQDRRDKEYEQIAWHDFVESTGRSDEYYWYLASGLTRGLVAARANLASTKTMGNLALRFWMSLTGAKETDRVLCGPTNVVWIEPWIEHISKKAKEKTVEFEIKQDTIQRLDVARGKIQRAVGENGPLEADYFISALPVEALVKVIEASPHLKEAGGGGQFSKLLALRDPRNGFLRKMSGLQIYLKKDVPLNRGHQIYLDSPWGLTSISQAQFWGPGLSEKYLPKGAGGVLSVDISSWDLAAEDGRTAEKCRPLEIFREVVGQIGSALGAKFKKELFGDPSYSNVFGWHLDDNDGGKLLVNNVGSWALRPDAQTALKNFFLAGDFARTGTDLACMEGANEAARRAVNALIAQVKDDGKTVGAEIPKCRVFSAPQSALFTAFQQMDSYRYGRALPWAGVSVGKWLLGGAQAGAAADEVVFERAMRAPELGGQGGKRIAVPTVLTTATSRLPRDDEPSDPTSVKALTPEQVAERLSNKETAGRVDPMFKRWRPYELKKDTHAPPRMIPFHAYDADGLILHGKAKNWSWLEKQTKGTRWHPARSQVGGHSFGFAELWIITYSDTTTGPYKELVINFVVTKDPDKPDYRWNSDYSALAPMNDPANRLFTPALLLNEEKPLQAGGPIAYGNDLLGTNKKPAKIRITTQGSVRSFDYEDSEGRVGLKGSVNMKVGPLDSAAASIELTRQLGALAVAQEFRQRAENAELDGGLVTASGAEIQASYKFAPTVGRFREGQGTLELLDKTSPFAGILADMEFEPVLFAHDPHLKTVLSIGTWPLPEGG